MIMGVRYAVDSTVALLILRTTLFAEFEINSERDKYVAKLVMVYSTPPSGDLLRQLTFAFSRARIQ